jgi:hypothetical protein
MNVDFLQPAQAELVDAITGYNLQSEGLGASSATMKTARLEPEIPSAALGPSAAPAFRHRRWTTLVIPLSEFESSLWGFGRSFGQNPPPRN